MTGWLEKSLRLEVDGDIFGCFHVYNQLGSLPYTGDCFARFLCKRGSSPGAHQKGLARTQLRWVRVCRLPGGGKSDTGG